MWLAVLLLAVLTVYTSSYKKFCETRHHAVGSIGTLKLARARIRYIHYSLSNEWVHAYLECGATALRKVRDFCSGSVPSVQMLGIQSVAWRQSGHGSTTTAIPRSGDIQAIADRRP